MVLLIAPLAGAQETGDSQMFLAGFNAYQQKDYPAAVARLNEVLQKHPDTPLRDMTLFWLARSYYKAGNRDQAARYMAQFNHEYPDNPLKNTVDAELLSLADQYEKNAGGTPKGMGTASQTLASQPAANEKAQAEEQAKLKAEAARKAREAEVQRLAAAQAAQEKAQAEKAQAEKAAKLKAQAEEQAKLKAEAARKAREAEVQRLAAAQAAQAAQEKAQAEKAAKLKAQAEKAPKSKVTQAKVAPRKKNAVTARRQALRTKAINDYTRIVTRFPGTPAARRAAARLKELGVAEPHVASLPKPHGEQVAENAQVLSFEVAQYAAFDFTLQPPKTAVQVAHTTVIPFELVNRGNGSDSFYLASAFPAEYNARFVAVTAPEQALNQTPLLAPGEGFKGRLQLTIPASAIDGLRITYPVRAASRLSGDSSQSREISLVASAPLLRAMVKADRTEAAPGELVTYRVTLLNLGTLAAGDVSLRLNYPPQYEPVNAAGFRQEMQAALVQDGIALKSGESRDFVVRFKVKEEALAREELVVRADILDEPLKEMATFHAAAISVKPVSAVSVRLTTKRVVVIPGQTVVLPVTVVNNGNQRERFSVVASAPSAQKVTVYQDLNRDGLRQPDEPAVTTIGPLGPKEEAALLLEVATNGTVQDGSEVGVDLRVAPESDQGAAAVANARLAFSRPVLQLALKGHGGLLVPGELQTVDLVVHNLGSNLAKGVLLRASWPAQLELVASDPAPGTIGGRNGADWQLHELGAGEKRVVKASFRVRPGTGVGTGIQVKSTLSYEDQLGNRY